MRRPGIIVCLALAAVLALPAMAHVGDLEADAQVSANGDVVVEDTLVLEPGYAVVYSTAPNGSRGSPLGHVPLEANREYQGLSVPIDSEVWAEWNGTRSVWLVLHTEAGGDGFDPAVDPVRERFGSTAGVRIPVRKGPTANVVVDGFGAQRTDGSTVTVRQVTTDEPAVLAIRPDTANGTGPVVGTRSLSAGVHENVSVAIDGRVFDGQRTVTFLAMLYPGDPATTEPIRAGGEPVGSYLPTQRVNDTYEGTETPLVVTPTETTVNRTTTVSGDGPGFGPVVTLAGLVAALAVLRRR